MQTNSVSPHVAGIGKNRKAWLAAFAVLAFFFSFSIPAPAQGVIRYEAQNLTDETVGEDLWQYTFYLTGYNFQANQGLSIFFDYQKFMKLAHPNQSSLDPIWNVLVVQRDLSLSADGFFDALATANSPSLATPFLVNFVYLGGDGNPGDLPFYTYDPGFNVISSGVITTVPEPGTWALLGLGSAAWLVNRFGRRRQ